MRINIEIPSSSSSAPAKVLPPSLAQLTPNGELVLIELQGSLEYDNHDIEGGQVLGKLEFHKGREDRPTLMISHHRLEGKIVNLTKPYAILERKKRNIAAISDEEQRSAMKEINLNRKEDIVYSSPAQESKRGKHTDEIYDADGNQRVEILNDDEEIDGPASPSMERKRARLEETPIRFKKVNASTNDVFSSSPMPRAPMRGSELDFSSPLPTALRPLKEPDFLKLDESRSNEKSRNEEWLHKSSTAIFYEVVCIIRKKILFSKRPEPVVRLDGEGGEKARLALGLTA